MAKPKKWHEVYPQGTEEGNEESRFFRSLSRNQKYSYRGIAAIVKASGLTHERVEEIIDKYVNQFDPPLIYAHPENDDHWGYWEVCGYEEEDKRSISKKDMDSRVKKHIDKNCS